MSEFKLTNEIVSRSHSQTWDHAKHEWALAEVYEADEPETCLCGHTPIIEICVLRNSVNGNHAEVGNCCVKKFMAIASHLVFDGLKRVRKDLGGAALNDAVIEHAGNSGWITPWEKGFLIDTMRKRVLSDKQASTRLRINQKVLRRFTEASQRQRS
jgi:hypothetical protein